MIIPNDASIHIFFALLGGRQEVEDGRDLNAGVFRIL